VIFIIAATIAVHYYGSNKNKKMALKYQGMLSPLLTKWFKKYDGELVL